MLKLLSRLLNRDLTTPFEPIDTNVSDAEIREILNPTNKTELSRKKKNLQLFVQFTTSHLSKSESQRLCRVAKRSLDDADDSFGALSEVIFGEDGQKRGQWAFIQLDWKATEEIVWQVTEILSVLRIEDRWERNCKAEFPSVPEALLVLSEWLKDRHLALLHLETNSDSYCSFVVKASDVEAAKALAMAAEITVYEHAEFANKNT
jgi:hypothetical protein